MPHPPPVTAPDGAQATGIEAIQGAVAVRQGKLQDGLAADDRTAIATFHAAST